MHFKQISNNVELVIKLDDIGKKNIVPQTHEIFT